MNEQPTKITAMDVARLAGVSQSAVSRVFTPGASASQATVEKVRAAAEQLGYRPDPLARAMITGRTRIIGLVVAYLENQFYPVVLELLSQALQARGYHVLVFMAENSTERVPEVMAELLDYQVDGIINADDPSNALYLDGTVMAVGAFPIDQVPQFSDESGRSGEWGGQSFTNLLRSASFEQAGGPWIDHRIEAWFNRVAHLTPLMMLTSATDWEFFYGPMIRDGLPWMIFTLFGAYGWSDVLLAGPWWRWLSWIIAGSSILGVAYDLTRRQVDAQIGAIITLFAISSSMVWLGNLVRLFITVMTSPLPFARYSFPVMMITVFGIVFGLSAFFRGSRQNHARLAIVAAIIVLNWFALLTMMKSYYPMIE